jgi:hypothetical protein
MLTRGRSSGRNNHSSRRNAQDSTKKGKIRPKKTLSDYQYYLGSARQASDYEKMTEYLINHIKKSFAFGNDVGTALKELEPYDMSQHHLMLQVSHHQDDAE